METDAEISKHPVSVVVGVHGGMFWATAARMHEDSDSGNVLGVNGRVPCRDGLGRSMGSRQ